MATTERDKVVGNLRACLISAPGGMMLSDLNKDYRSLVGEVIPFRRIGFNSLDEFVQFLPDVNITKRGGDWHIEARAAGGSSHISKLVQGQKKNSSKKPRKAKFAASKFSRPAPSNFRPSPSQVPHFMKPPSAGTTTKKKPRAQYIAPTMTTNKYSEGSEFQYVAPQDLPVTTYPAGGNKSSVSNSHSKEDDRLSLAPGSLAPIVPAFVSPAPVSPEPFERVKTYQKVSKPSLTDRLNVYKKTTMGLSSISESLNQIGSGKLHNLFSGSVNVESNHKPEICELTVIDPISWNKSKNRRPYDTGSLRTVDIQPYQYDDESYVFQLSRYSEKRNWTKPNFVVLNRRSGSAKYPESRYICRVSITTTPLGSNDQSAPCHEFSTYPDEFPDVNSAMNHVALKAFRALVEKEKIQLPETADTSTILRRISEMVRGKGQGVWLYQIEKNYKEQFNECLPPDLPAMLDRCPTLEITKLAESCYIVRPIVPEVESAKYLSPHFVSRLTVNKLCYPPEETWDVFVSKVKSLNEIYIRIIGDQYSAVYEELATKMDHHYVNRPSERPECIEVGKYYALVTLDSSFRVLVTSIYNDEYQVYLIDVGDVDFVKPENLRVLLPDFYSVASQAIPCFLVGLHNYDFSITSPEISREVDDLILARSFASLLSDRDPIHLTLFDTESDEDINMNMELKRLVDRSFCYPVLAEEGVLKEIQVMTVDRAGQVYIQIPSWTLDCLNEKIALISNGFYEVSYVSSIANISKDKIYFWSHGPTRIKVVRVISKEQLEVNFIDTGGEKIVDIRDIYEIEQLNDFISKIPPQALPILLHDVNDGTLKTHQVQRFLDMVNSNSESPNIGKVVSYIDGEPHIEIYVRNEASNLMICVNSNISLCESMSSRLSQVSMDQRSVSSVPASTCSHADGIFLKGIAPKVGEDLDIYVTGIASPNNFTVTPVSYLKFLNELTEEMIIFYSSLPFTEVYKPRIGECVAAQSDGCWFRVQIDKKLDCEMYSGKYLDHGHMDVFPNKCLRGLPEKFRKLPYLAFKAQLHGIKPINKDWNVEDCLAVKAMIHNKKLYSKVMGIINDVDGKKKLSLEIVDTSGDTDLFISRQLMIEQRAIPDLSNC